jgi:hypothetical protein
LYLKELQLHKRIICRCSANEKLEIIPEGELKPKAQVLATLQSIRSSGNNKRLSNAEISSTTLNAVYIFLSSFYLPFENEF